MRSILVSANEDPGMDLRLQAALDFARATNGHVTVLFDLPVTRYIAMDALGGSYLVREAFDAARQDEERAIHALEDRLAREDVPFDVLRSEDEPATALALASRMNDVVVVSRGSGLAGTVALTSRVPVLVLPDDRPVTLPPRRVAIAWDGGDEAARALRASVPAIAGAETVEVISIAEKSGGFPATDVLRYLSRHGIKAGLTEQQRRGSVEESLAVAVAAARPDLLVMGAYGKSRLREYLFGGVTAHFLTQSSGPALFLVH